MLNVENEILDNINTENIFPIDNDSFEVINLIKDYELQKDNSIINTIESQYEVITDFIIGIYLEKYDLPKDLKKLIKKSHNYRIYLLSNVKERMKNIIEESSMHLFKEIYIAINLLSNGKRYELLTENNSFSIFELQKLLHTYEDEVCEQFLKNDKQSFNLTFQYYITLLELLNQICVIKSLDIQKRKNVNQIIELITNTITNLKNKILLDEESKKSLNVILGKLLLYFTNMVYIPIDTNNKNVVIQKYSFMINKIQDGFSLLNKEDKYYFNFLDKLTTLILTLIYKLKTKLNIQNINFEDSKEIEEIFNLYNKHVKESEKIKVNNLNDFRDKLLLNYKYIYIKVQKVSIPQEEDFIEYFISLDEISNLDMIIIHNIVLYSEDLAKEKLDKLITSLLEKNKFDNDYYEFYKLKIIDRVLQKYISLKIETSKNLLIEPILNYIEENNIVSHLMSIYSKVYLSLALYYSYERLESSQEKSKKFYFIYQRLDKSNFLEKEFQTISKQILYNYAKNYFRFFMLKTQHSYTSSDLVHIGKDLINKYINSYELQLKNEIFTYVEKLLNKILKIDEPNDDWLNKEIEVLLDSKIFFGLVQSKIINKEQALNVIEVGYDYSEIELQDHYSLRLYYSSFYKSVVENILKKEKQCLELLTKNLFKSYINSIPSFTDVITKLPNINKLKADLKKLDKEEIVFFEVYLNALVNFSESNNVKISNGFFKAITDKVNEKIDTYRLFGPKIGIVLEKEVDYYEIITFLQELKVDYMEKNYEINPTIAVSKGYSYNILDKSFYALSSAKISDNKLFIYE